MERPGRRPRITVDAPIHVVAAARKTAEEFFRGSLSDAVIGGLTMFQWLARQRRAGRRVIAVSEDQLPQAFEEPVIPGLEQAMTDTWTWLVVRDHPWRRQLWVKGRNLTAGSVARTVEIEGWTPEQAAHQFDLETDAVLEAIRYAEANGPLIAAEEAEDRLAAAAATGGSSVAVVR